MTSPEDPLHPFRELVRLVVLADQDGNPTRALAAHRELATMKLEGRQLLQSLLLLRFLGRQAESKALCLDLSNKTERLPVTRPENDPRNRRRR